MANNQTPNLPTIVFTKRVGQAPLKAFVQNVIETTLLDLVEEQDANLREVTLEVVLTRSNTGRTQGSMGYTWDIQGVPTRGKTYGTDLKTFTLMLNLGRSADAHKDDGDLIKTLMHETIHMVQMVTGMMTVQGTYTGRRSLHTVTTWNVTAGHELNFRARGRSCIMVREPRSLTTQEGDRVETINRPPNSKGDRNYARYLAMPHERQAWTQVLPLSRRLFPVAVEACRKSFKTAVTEPPKHLKGARIFQ